MLQNHLLAKPLKTSLQDIFKSHPFCLDVDGWLRLKQHFAEFILQNFLVEEKGYPGTCDLLTYLKLNYSSSNASFYKQSL